MLYLVDDPGGTPASKKITFDNLQLSLTKLGKVTVTQPATASTLTVANGKTLTASNTLTLTGTDGSSVACGAGGTVAYTGNDLSVFAATTSAQLLGVISDETGSGSLVFGTSPTLTTPNIGVATATSVNKVTLTAPTTTATLTLVDGTVVTAPSTTGTLALNTAASETVAGLIEIATAAETTTGTDATRAISPDGFSQSDYGKRLVQLKVMDDTTTVTTGDGKIIFCIPSELNGMNLVAAQAYITTVSSSGLPTVMIRNVTDAADMLSTAITIDASEFTSYTAVTPPVVNAATDDVATGDRIAVDIDGAGTGAKGLGVLLSFATP